MSQSGGPDTSDPSTRVGVPRLGQAQGGEPEALLPSGAIEAALGMSLQQALNLEAWEEGGGLGDLLVRVGESVRRSAAQEERIARLVRDEVLRQLGEFLDAPEQAGVYQVEESLLREAKRNILLRGNLAAAEGARGGHDGLAGSLVVVGVGVVRYDGLLNSWKSTFLRQEYRAHISDPVEEVRQVLNARARRGGEGDRISRLLGRGVMAAAERKALLQLEARWRMGHGVPAPLELLTGSGSMELIDEALPILEQLLLDETRWVFVPDGLHGRALATLAAALNPGELAIFQKGKPMLADLVERGTYDVVRKRRVQAFAARAGEAWVVGGFRATRYAPGQLFIAHKDRALEAGTIALADASLQPHRGWPLLLELARLTARNGLALDAFAGVVEAAYAREGAYHLYYSGTKDQHG